jgi:hypothetical protein
MSPKATYRGVAYDTDNKGQIQFNHPGNQVYRGVEVDYNNYQQHHNNNPNNNPASIVVLSMLRNEIPDTFTGNLSCSD